MKRFIPTLLLALGIGILGCATVALAEELKPRSATPVEIGKRVQCPVMNIKFEVARDTPVIDYKGKSYYFCCDHCVGDFRKDPDKFAESGELIARAPTVSELGRTVGCSVMNVKFEVAQHTPVIDYRGKSYYFCCDHCLEEFKKNPDKFARK